MGEQISLMQTLLNAEATISNLSKDEYDLRVRKQLHNHIINIRSVQPPPPCHGEDDCSTNILSMCPWRIDCG